MKIVKGEGCKRLIVYLIVFLFICFDVLTGFMKALYNGKVSSGCLRKGMIRKFSELVILFGCDLLQYTMVYFDLGLQFSIFKPMAGYICVMEFVSIVENICVVVPQFKVFFEPYLAKLQDGEKNNEERD